MPELNIGTTLISYSIRKSMKAKHVSLSIGVDGVQVVAPFTMNDSVIISLVEGKQNSIFSKFKAYRQRHMHTRAERESRRIHEDIIYKLWIYIGCCWTSNLI